MFELPQQEVDELESSTVSGRRLYMPRQGPHLSPGLHGVHHNLSLSSCSNDKVSMN